MNTEHVPFFKRILLHGEIIGASDIHISVGNAVSYRNKNGEILKAEDMFGKKLDKTAVKAIYDYILENMLSGPNEKAYIEKKIRTEKDSGFSFIFNETKTKYRVNVGTYKEGYYIVLRSNKVNPPRLNDLGLSENSYSFLKSIVSNKESGLFLVVGATGSGKSTTLAAMIEEVNTNFKKNIITLEDPIEYEYEPKKAHVVQKELGRDIVSFDKGLRSALREDPDIILVGEIRDFDTLNLALTAAETGHMVFSTLHTKSALSTINRIIAMANNNPDFIRNRLGETLVGIMAQKLIPSKNGGRVLLWEILSGEKKILENIKNNNINEVKALMDNTSNCQSFDKTLLYLFTEDKIDRNTLEKYALENNYNELSSEIKQLLDLRNEVNSI